MGKKEIRVMSIMAHQDDFEFSAAGLFAILRERYQDRVKIKILASTRGASGHHEMSLEETAARREKEAKRSAGILGAEYGCLRCLDGSFPDAQLFIDRNTLGGLWNEIREFGPDYIFCPPATSDPLAGIHIDHYNTAWAVRMTAYQLTVPHAYPVSSPPHKERTVYPVIINVHDGYAGENIWHVNMDISSVYDKFKTPMALSHESQVFEWLPWNSGQGRFGRKEFLEQFKKRHTLINKRYGMDNNVPREYFRFTDWGKNFCASDAETVFPGGVLSEPGRDFISRG